MVSSIQRLWRGDKGRLPTQLELPPLTYDGGGFPFAVAEARDELCLCNQNHLLLWQQVRRRAEFVGAFHLKPLTRASLWGICPHPEGWLIVYTEAEKLWMGVVDRKLRLQERIALRGFLTDYNPTPPLQVQLSPQNLVYFGYPETLVAVDLQGNTKGVRPCPRGFALRENGALVCASDLREAPEGQPSARLISAFAEGERLVWLGERRLLRERQPYFQTQLLFTQGGKLQGRLVLNGAAGAIEALRKPSQVEWVVAPQWARVYVLGWTYAGTRGSVGIWRIELRL